MWTLVSEKQRKICCNLVVAGGEILDYLVPNVHCAVVNAPEAVGREVFGQVGAYTILGIKN